MSDETMVQFQTRRRAELVAYARGDHTVPRPGTGMWPAVLPITPPQLRVCSTCTGYTITSGPNVCRKCGLRTP